MTHTNDDNASHHHHEGTNPPQVSLLLRDGFRARAYFAKLLLSSLATAMSSSYQKTRTARKEKEQVSGCLEKESARGTGHGRG